MKSFITVLLFYSILAVQTVIAQQDDSDRTNGIPGPVSPVPPMAPDAPLPPVSPGEQPETDEREPSGDLSGTIPEDSSGQEQAEDSSNGVVVPEAAEPSSETNVEPVPEPSVSAQDAVQTPALFRFSRVPDTNLVAQPPQQIGEIGELRDIVLTDTGRVSFYIAGIKELQGFRAGLYILPSALLTFDEQQAMLELPAAQDGIVFIQDERLIRQYYPSSSVLASRLVGFDVIGPDGRRVGSIEDIVLDLERGEVVYVALARSGFLGFGTRFHAVPFSGIRFDEDREEITVNVSADRIDDMDGFDEDFWPVRSDPTWPVQPEAPTDSVDQPEPESSQEPDHLPEQDDPVPRYSPG